MAGSLCSQWVVSMAGEDRAAGGGGGETRQVVEGWGPIFPSGCEGTLGVAQESLQGRRDLT